MFNYNRLRYLFHSDQRIYYIPLWPCGIMLYSIVIMWYIYHHNHMTYVYEYNHRIYVEFSSFYTWYTILITWQIFVHMIHSMYSDLRWTYDFINFNNYHTEYSIVIVMLMRYKIRLQSSDVYVVTIYSIVVTWHITAS